MAPERDSDTVYVDTDALANYSRTIFGQAGGFQDGAFGNGQWARPAQFRQLQMDGRYLNAAGEVDRHEAVSSMEAPMPEAAQFWNTAHATRMVQMAQFSGQLGLSLLAISAASGAIVQGYESTDGVNADRIRAAEQYFRGVGDDRADTLAGELERLEAEQGGQQGGG